MCHTIVGNLDKFSTRQFLQSNTGEGQLRNHKVGKYQRREVGGSAGYWVVSTTQEAKKGFPGEHPSVKAEAFPRNESSPLQA